MVQLQMAIAFLLGLMAAAKDLFEVATQAIESALGSGLTEFVRSESGEVSPEHGFRSPGPEGCSWRQWSCWGHRPRWQRIVAAWKVPQVAIPIRTAGTTAPIMEGTTAGVAATKGIVPATQRSLILRCEGDIDHSQNCYLGMVDYLLRSSKLNEIIGELANTK